MAPKDTDNKLQKSGVIYRFKCAHINCLEEYIGESGRTFDDRLKEHLRAPSPIHHHINSTGHPVNPDCFTIVDKQSQEVSRNIKEAMYISVNDNSYTYRTKLQLKINTVLLPPTWANPKQQMGGMCNFN